MTNDGPSAIETERGTAPRTLQALRELALDIGRSGSGVSPGGKAHTVLARLVDMPEQAAVRSISDLAALLDVSASTLTRLSQRLGFAGFSDFQSVFRDAIADDRRYFYSRQVGRLLRADRRANEQTDPFERLAEETAANVQGFLSQLEPAVLSKARSRSRRHAG